MNPDELQAALEQRATQVDGILQQKGITPAPEQPVQLPQAAAPAPVRAQTQGDVQTTSEQPGKEQPSEADQLEQALQDKQQAASATMRDQGIADPADIGPIQNYVNGFNNRVAKILSLPGDTINGALQAVGVKFFDSGMSDYAITKKVMDQLGVRTDTYKALSSQLGESTLDGAITLGTMLAAAPFLAAHEGAGAMSVITREFGQFLLKNPGVATVMEAGARTGSAVAGDLTEGSPYQGVADVAGGLLGGGIGMGAAKLAGATGRLLMKPVEGIARATGLMERPPALPDANVAGPLDTVAPGARQAAMESNYTIPQRVGDAYGLPPRPTLATTPIYNPEEAKSAYPRYFAQEQVEGANAQIDAAVNDAVDKISTRIVGNGARARPITAEQAQVELREGIDDAYTHARDIEKDFWARVPMGEKVPSSEIVPAIDQMNTRLTNNVQEGFIPRNFMEDIYKTFATPQGEDGRFAPNTATVGRLRSVASDISEHIYREPYNRQLNANRTQLLGIINDAVGSAIPDNVALSQARAVSTKVNDLFTRGPIADLRAVGPNRAPNVPPAQSTQFLLKQFQGIKSALNLGDIAKIPRAFGQDDAYNVATKSITARPVVEGIRQNLEDSIRAMIKEEANQYC